MQIQALVVVAGASFLPSLWQKHDTRHRCFRCKVKGGFSANDLFAAGATKLAISAELFISLGQNRSLIHLVR